MNPLHRLDVESVARVAGRASVFALDLVESRGLALSLASEGPFRRVVATDLSADALEVAVTLAPVEIPQEKAP